MLGSVRSCRHIRWYEVIGTALVARCDLARVLKEHRQGLDQPWEWLTQEWAGGVLEPGQRGEDIDGIEGVALAGERCSDCDGLAFINGHPEPRNRTCRGVAGGRINITCAGHRAPPVRTGVVKRSMLRSRCRAWMSPFTSSLQRATARC